MGRKLESDFARSSCAESLECNENAWLCSEGLSTIEFEAGNSHHMKLGRQHISFLAGAIFPRCRLCRDNG